MDVNFPSIQSFYSRELQPSSQGTSDGLSKSQKPGDGFTSSEVEAVLDPLSRPWKPSRHYETCPISLLETGPHNYQISGRIVNFADNFRDQGFHFLVVTDGSGAIAVKVYYIKVSDYQLLLGRRVTIWTTFIGDSTGASSGSIPFCSSTTTLYPGRNGATHIIVHNDDPGSDGDRILRCPLECNLKEYEYLPALMTLKSFLSTGYDLGEGKILVCVRSVGPRRTVQSKKTQQTLEMVEVGIFDDTATCVLKLWEGKVPSAKSWVPNETILLISKPTYKNRGTSPELGIGFSSMVDVNPMFPDADWLRNKVKSMAKKQSVYIPFPSNTWDTERAINGPDRTLFTIADVEDRVRHPESIVDFTGKMNVVILEMKLMEHWRKGTLCYLECCNMPLYSNKPVAICKNCELKRDLVLNQRIIGSMVDESGMIAANKLVWRDGAWTQLFFGSAADETQEVDSEPDLIEQSWEDLTTLGTESLRYMEEFLLYSRVTLTFGWSSQPEKVCVLGVEW
ncbi:uncharacterized protein F4807DRAFT_472960 [Annulohypoxylon truncatum]|uniref:uncharacterized protein n=1 Tax=Annulohypoxylon truncatum TaxID=327061 RepID=UPI002008D5ED|nr:uncharacterized protein F4807DRAFT_472960 [Annulohypoxylon truncatum]KAI1211503.1 hypothetical protein F4807DRAFT_472960 [Annulohypoxylon truncatum]